MKGADVTLLRQFIGRNQLRVMLTNTDPDKCEEAAFFQQMITDLAARIRAMPKTYEQDGLGDAAVVHLHYFTGGADWFIYEKDMETKDEPGQHQAFGLADLYGDGGELGYISIVELLANGAELDLYWTPKTLGEIRKKRESPSFEEGGARALAEEEVKALGFDSLEHYAEAHS